MTSVHSSDLISSSESLSLHLDRSVLNTTQEREENERRTKDVNIENFPASPWHGIGNISQLHDAQNPPVCT